MGEEEGVFVLWFSGTQKNASQNAFLRFAMVYLKMPNDASL